MTERPTVHEAFAKVMSEVGAIAKDDVNQAQRFNFRGIDATMNTVGPALRKHGVVIVPEAMSIESERYATAKGGQMRNATVHMKYTVFGPAGDSFTGSTYGEAADAGDKAVSKAQSVAYRTFLLQGLTVPTQERDPDADVHERADTPQQARMDLAQVLKRRSIDPKDATQKFADDGHGNLGQSTDIAAIRGLITFFERGK